MIVFHSFLCVAACFWRHRVLALLGPARVRARVRRPTKGAPRAARSSRRWRGQFLDFAFADASERGPAVWLDAVRLGAEACAHARRDACAACGRVYAAQELSINKIHGGPADAAKVLVLLNGRRAATTSDAARHEGSNKSSS